MTRTPGPARGRAVVDHVLADHADAVGPVVDVLGAHCGFLRPFADPNGGRLTRQRPVATSRPAWSSAIPLSALRPARPGCCTWGTCARRCSIGCSPSGTAAPSSCASTTPTGSAASPNTKPRSSATLPGSASTGRARSGRSDRLPHYDAARDRLIAIGRLYPCYETPEELEFKRKRLLAQGRPPVYDRAALKLSDADRARLEGEGRRPHWRFKLATEEVRWDDLVRGPAAHRRGEPERSGAGARRRQLSLQLHLGGRRHRASTSPT